MDEPRRIPFTLLTGFLGAGKTTTLNRVLGSGRAERLAVLVNDVGRVNVDRSLIRARAGDILELSGGCVCCQVDLQRNLWDGIVDLARRSAPEQIVLETTGIAQPEDLIAQLEEEPIPRTHLSLAGVICAVEAEAGAAELARHAEARAQVQAADRLLLTKLDLVPSSSLAALHSALDPLNGHAERAAFTLDRAGDQALAAWLLAQRERTTRSARTAHTHGQLSVVTVEGDEAYVLPQLRAVLERFRPGLVRVKGFVRTSEAPRSPRAFVELAGNRLTVTEGAGAPGRSGLVLIGEGVDAAALERQLAACRTSVQSARRDLSDVPSEPA